MNIKGRKRSFYKFIRLLPKAEWFATLETSRESVCCFPLQIIFCKLLINFYSSKSHLRIILKIFKCSFKNGARKFLFSSSFWKCRRCQSCDAERIRRSATRLFLVWHLISCPWTYFSRFPRMSCFERIPAQLWVRHSEGPLFAVTMESVRFYLSSMDNSMALMSADDN